MFYFELNSIHYSIGLLALQREEDEMTVGGWCFEPMGSWPWVAARNEGSDATAGGADMATAYNVLCSLSPGVADLLFLSAQI